MSGGRGAPRWRVRSSTAARCGLVPTRCDRRRRAHLDAGTQGADSAGHRRIPDEDAFRFRHLLIREAAYAALSRSSAHNSTSGSPMARRTNSSSGTRLGYHLEQAFRLHAELDIEDPALTGLAVQGSRPPRCRRTQAALDHGDSWAARSLLERATSVLPSKRRGSGTRSRSRPRGGVLLGDWGTSVASPRILRSAKGTASDRITSARASIALACCLLSLWPIRAVGGRARCAEGRGGGPCSRP